MTRKRLGWPPAPPDQARPHRLVTFVRDEEYAQIKKLAEERQTSLSNACNRLICYGLKVGQPKGESD